jgi:hypothetical protein
MTNQNGNEQKDGAGSASRSDTTSPGGAQPVKGQSGKVGADIAGAAGSDAAAGAKMGGDGGHGPRGQPDAGSPDGAPDGNLAPGAGAAAAGATGLGEASPADDTHDGAGGSPGA